MSTAKTNTVLLKEMNELRGAISTEAISMAGIGNALSSMIPSFKELFDVFMNQFTGHTDPVALKANEVNFLKMIENRPYLNLVPLGTYVPEGLSATYLEYLVVLEDATHHCERSTTAAINDYSMLVSQLVTNKNMKYAMPSEKTKHDLIEKDRLDIVTRMGACFANGSTETNSNYGDVVSRNGDWHAIFTMMHSVSNGINKISRDALQKKADECSKLLELIIKQVKEEQFNGAAPEVVNNLAAGAYQVAAELEFYAVTFYRATAMANALTDTVKHLTEIIASQEEQ